MEFFVSHCRLFSFAAHVPHLSLCFWRLLCFTANVFLSIVDCCCWTQTGQRRTDTDNESDASALDFEIFAVRSMFTLWRISSHPSHRYADDGIACEHTHSGAACINSMVSLLSGRTCLFIGYWICQQPHTDTSDACTQRRTKLASKTLEIIMLAVWGA